MKNYCDDNECSYITKCTDTYGFWQFIKSIISEEFVKSNKFYMYNDLNGKLHILIDYSDIKNIDDIRIKIHNYIKSKGYELRYENMYYGIDKHWNDLTVKMEFKRICFQ